MAWNVAISARDFDIAPEAGEYLSEYGCSLHYLNKGDVWADAELRGDSLISTLKEMDAIIGGPRLGPPEIARLVRLKHISRRGLGYDMIDVPSATEAGIVLTITPNTTEDGVADHVFALLLAAAREVPRADAELRRGNWGAITGVELFGKRLGIIGLGRVGQKVARRAQGFDMDVVAFDTHPTDSIVGVRYCSLDELLKGSDFVSINVDLNDTTRGLVGRRELACMKRSAILVNASRGPVVDEDALYECLASHGIASAGIDTFVGERLRETRLSELQNVVLTPHMGGHTVEGIARANMRAARNVVGVMRGKLDFDSDLVNPSAWSRRLACEGRFEGVAPEA